MNINHNLQALNTLRNLNVNNSKMSKSLAKLASGYRVNVAADDPAGLVISEKLRAQNRGLQRAMQNTQEASNVIGIAEGALTEMNSILETMRGLALHAANSGVTSSDQIEADQAEMDSSVQAIDRIASSTKYGGECLINGGKAITYTAKISKAGAQNSALINTALSNINQLPDNANVRLSISFNGSADALAASGIGAADISKEACKGYFELNASNSSAYAVDAVSNAGSTTILTKDQSFTVSGVKGSCEYSFNAGTTVGEMVRTIQNDTADTGVDASLAFNSNQTSIVLWNQGTGNSYGIDGTRINNAMVVANNYVNGQRQIDAYCTIAPLGIIIGQNTDGMGRMFVKVISNTNYEIYRDESLSEESLVGHGTFGLFGTHIVQMDNTSGIDGISLIAAPGMVVGSVVTLYASGLSGQQALADGTSSIAYSGTFANAAATTANTYDNEDSTFCGVQLGNNTDMEGKIYLKTVVSPGSSIGQVFAYNAPDMADDSLVAQSQAGINLSGNTTFVMSAVNSSGLAIALTTGQLSQGFSNTGTTAAAYTGVVQFTNIGARLSSSEYGSSQFVSVTQEDGTIWQYYDQADSATPTLVKPDSTAVRCYGQDASVQVNGTAMTTDGLTLNITTDDLSANIVFNEGKVGNTTIAQVGYNEGTVFSKCTMLASALAGKLGGNNYYDPSPSAEGHTNAQYILEGSDDGSVYKLDQFGALLTNVGHNTTETLNDFQGGMTLQLNEGASENNRTIIGIQSMSSSNLGKIDNPDGTDILSLQDLIGGGTAALGNHSDVALNIIDQAIDDVSSLRARLGALQANYLQTNYNSLGVAVENITSTESAIRDADISREAGEFARNQVLVKAATSVLAQANAAARNVLDLLKF